LFYINGVIESNSILFGVRMTRLLYLPDDTTVIQLDVETQPSQLSAAINAGMRPLPILQKAPPGKLSASVLGGTVIVAPLVKKETANQSKPTSSGLSRRQAQVHDLTVRGLTSGEIAVMLHLSRRTVNYHLNQVKNRLRQSDLPQKELRPLAFDFNAED
jgi:DNA-binding NarL/FixJ family response regulator